MAQLKTLGLLGTHVRFCNLRRRYLTGFYGKKEPALGDFYTLNYLTEGKMQVEMEGARFTAARGEALLWKPNLPRMIQALPGRPLSYYAMGFEPATVAGDSFSPDRFGLKPFCTVNRRAAMSGLFQRLNRTFLRKDRYRDQECSILGLKILLLLEPRAFPAPFQAEYPDDRPSDERVQDILDYIHRNYKKRIGVNTLASRVLMHPVHFTRFFRKATGLTPHQYILQLKVEKAKDFLLFYNESLTYTAAELGFHDYAHFFRVFKQITGMSPRKFLERSRSV